MSCSPSSALGSLSSLPVALLSYLLAFLPLNSQLTLQILSQQCRKVLQHSKSAWNSSLFLLRISSLQFGGSIPLELIENIRNSHDFVRNSKNLLVINALPAFSSLSSMLRCSAADSLEFSRIFIQLSSLITVDCTLSYQFFPNLSELTLARSGRRVFQFKSMNWLQECAKLSHLTLHGVIFDSKEGLNSLSSLPQLSSLNLVQIPQFDRENCSSVRNCRNLATLKLFQCKQVDGEVVREVLRGSERRNSDFGAENSGNINQTHSLSNLEHLFTDYKLDRTELADLSCAESAVYHYVEYSEPFYAHYARTMNDDRAISTNVSSDVDPATAQVFPVGSLAHSSLLKQPVWKRQ
jgi:hypothetical protein